jgi:hypothetical protein
MARVETSVEDRVRRRRDEMPATAYKEIKPRRPALLEDKLSQEKTESIDKSSQSVAKLKVAAKVFLLIILPPYVSFAPFLSYATIQSLLCLFLSVPLSLACANTAKTSPILSHSKPTPLLLPPLSLLTRFCYPLLAS